MNFTCNSVREDGCSTETDREIRNIRKGGEEKIGFPLVKNERRRRRRREFWMKNNLSCGE